MTGLNGKVATKEADDSCILVGNAMQVASGKPFSTERIMCLEFVEGVAPRDIHDDIPYLARDDTRSRAWLL